MVLGRCAFYVEGDSHPRALGLEVVNGNENLKRCFLLLSPTQL